jgi:hypothetical protein
MRAPACQTLVSLSFVLILTIGVSKNCQAQESPRQNNQITASPTFVDAKNDAERCQAVNAWLSSIKADFEQAVAEHSAGEWFSRGTRKADMMLIDQTDYMELASHSFRRNIGKPLPALSEKQGSQLARAVSKCSSEAWVQQRMYPFLFSYGPVSAWRSDFERLEGRYEISRNQRRQLYDVAVGRERFDETALDVGPVLIETISYKLYKSYYGLFTESPYSWCSQGNTRMAMVTMVFQDENAVVDNDSKYWNRFETELLPGIVSQCPDIERVYVVNYVKGYHIFYADREITTHQRSRSGFSLSEPLSSGIYLTDPTATPRHFWFYGAGSGNLMQEATKAGRGKIEVPTSGTSARLTDPSLTTLRSLKAVFDELQKQEYLIKQRETEKRAREASEAYEAARQRKIPNDRSIAAGTLATLKRGARDPYDFAGYAYEDRWQSIYDGKFEYFTGGYMSAKDLDMEMLNSVFTGGPYSGLSSAAAKGTDITFRRHFLNMAFYAYHNLYAQRCSNNKEFPWVQSNPGLFSSSSVTKRGGYEVNRSTLSKEGISHLVRQPFVDTYDSAYLSVANYNNVSPEMPQDLLDDISRILNSEGCSSPSLRHFEVNLALARDWLLPLQLLRTTEGKSEPVAEKAKSASPNSKQKPASRPPTRRVRPRG